MVALADEVKASSLLVFAIDDVSYGLAADDIVELSRAVAVGPVPEPDPGHLLEGIVNFHGELAAAINLRSRFGHPPKELHHSEHFIFSRAGRHLLALRVDAVKALITAPVEALDVMTAHRKKPAANVDRGQSVAGVCKLADGLVFIFDMQTFLSKGDAQMVESTLRAARNQNAGDSAK
jgi:chemotaxis signal transduction protein